MSMTKSPKTLSLNAIIEEFRPDLSVYENFYRRVHCNPEMSSLELETAATVKEHLERLGFEAHNHIGGHGVVGVLKNGPGEAVLTCAELDALPIEEQTDLPYRRSPVMHACGHDMNMASLLAASALIKAAEKRWSGTLITLFQPAEEETGEAQAMVDDAVKSGPVLVAADSINVRVIGGPCQSVNPQACVDPILLSMRTIPQLDDYIPQRIEPDDDFSVACWGFHAGIPGMIMWPFDPVFKKELGSSSNKRSEKNAVPLEHPKTRRSKVSVRAPLTSNDQAITARIQQHVKDSSILGSKHNIPYTYWNFGGSGDTEGEIPKNHQPFFAPNIELLSFLSK
ncbi:Zn-dependent exopeptidase [Patellaria atrata CBS 101060]|uniref:Zn-dependent exopeptidase n=1 Tax=Patellaria atrata CBS 101060 TaxID=1346257 RepID=A0A9P4VSN9_9PEZI|nr:Zn-dependent exopeptidase [Patellaria atrata CBS 101060]